MSNDTYVYNGKEVKLTGRKAVKEVPTHRSRRSSASTHTEEYLYEIIPVDTVVDWKQWVKLEDLHRVMQPGEKDADSVEIKN